MKLSIIVPAYNEEKLIEETLRHIQAAPTYILINWKRSRPWTKWYDGSVR